MTDYRQSSKNRPTTLRMKQTNCFEKIATATNNNSKRIEQIGDNNLQLPLMSEQLKKGEHTHINSTCPVNMNTV